MTFGGPQRVCVLPVLNPGDKGCIVTSAGYCAINGGEFVADRNQCPNDISTDFQPAYYPVTQFNQQNELQFFTPEGAPTSLATLGAAK